MRYRCPECGGVEIRADGEYWVGLDVNTGEVVTDVFDNPPVFAGGGDADERPSECFACCNECEWTGTIGDTDTEKGKS